MSSPGVPDDAWGVVLAGGRGTRFWPLSRRARPKQCLSLEGGVTLLERAIARAGVPAGRVLVVTGPEMEASVRDLAEPLGARVIVEPSPRGTAPAIAWAAREVARAGGRRMLVLPADHVVRDESAFAVACAHAWEATEAGGLVTFGIRATRPETGFGWIVAESAAAGAQRVARFVEKPPAGRAAELLAQGAAWNAGIFAWRVDVLDAALARFLPRTRAALDAVVAGMPLAGGWDATDAVSIDVGVLERATNVVVVPVDCGWSDVGAWSALDEVLDPTPGGTVHADAVLAEDAAGNLVHAAGKLVALLGVDDLVVVDTPDVLLVTRRERAQDVRALVDLAERTGLRRYT